MKHKGPKGPKQQVGHRPPAPAQRGRSGADRGLVGRRYETGAAMRAVDGAGPAAEPPPQVRDEMSLRAEALRGEHGPRIEAGARRAGVPPEAAAAVMLTESGGLPGLREGQMPVRFEPYAFYQRTGRWLVATHKDQAAERQVFEQARQIDGAAAHASLRMGIGQVSGAEAGAAGYESAEQMHGAMSGSVQAQIDGLFNVIAADADLQQALGREDWRAVAELRAGPGYGALGFDDALVAWAEAYRRASAKSLGGGDDDDDKPDKRRNRRPGSEEPR